MIEVDLINWPRLEAAELCGLAAAICTGSQDYEKSMRGAMLSGHESIAEHANFTFVIKGVSRVLLAQLTRHRVASYSVESQRYCGIDNMLDHVVRPDSWKEHGYVGSVDALLMQIQDLYDSMLKDGVPQEDARYIVPQGINTKLMLTMNVRELRHFFSLRMCRRAQWQIRWLADKMYVLCMQIYPQLFYDAGPGCVRGHCPEGKRSCKKPRDLKSEFML